jgi:hypothetical protein
MKTLRLLLAFAGLASGLAALAADPKTALTAESASKLALGWIAHVDASEYAQSWKEASVRFKASVTEEKWVAAMNQVRQPLGNVGAREFAEGTFANELPRAPKGEYWVVKYRTNFEGVSANEVVTLTADPDGAWRVVGYFIRPAS